MVESKCSCNREVRFQELFDLRILLENKAGLLLNYEIPLTRPRASPFQARNRICATGTDLVSPIQREDNWSSLTHLL